METNLLCVLQDGDVDGEFKMLTAEELLSNDIEQLRMMVIDRKDEELRGKGPEKKKEKAERAGKPDKAEKSAPAAAAAATAAVASKASGQAAAAEKAPAATGPAPMDEDSLDVPASSVLTLSGHESEVYICAWSPTEPLLASG